MHERERPTLLSDRLRGAIWGLLVGDALGVPYEFHEPDELLWSDAIQMEPPAWFDRSHKGTPPGTWSDDGAQALCLLASLLERRQFDPEDFARRLVAWREDGYMAVDGRVFDCGITTHNALRALRSGKPPLLAGPSDEFDNGNGSLMRVLPLALWHVGTDSQLVELAHMQSLITHGHPRSQVCCALYCLWARKMLESESAPWTSAVATLRTAYGDSPLRTELETHVRPDDEPGGGGTGYVVDSLHTVRRVMLEASYERVVREAIGHGRDTDTTACIAGGLAGIRDGIGGIPGGVADRIARKGDGRAPRRSARGAKGVGYLSADVHLHAARPHVSKTRIFGRRVGDRQVLAYEMQLASATDVAMILPLPIAARTDNPVAFIDLSEYEHFFDDLERCFPRPLTRSLGGAVAAGGAPLVVHRVGAFDASFVPQLAEFHRHTVAAARRQTWGGCARSIRLCS